MENLLLKPDVCKDYRGWEKVNLGKPVTNVHERNYKYLLSKAGIEAPETVSKNGVKFLTIGKACEPINVAESEVVIKIDNDGVAIYGNTAEEISLGVKMLVDMRLHADSKGTLPLGEFRYTPKLRMRAVHMCLFPLNEIAKDDEEDTSLAQIRRRAEIAALSGYNYILLEMWGVFPFEKRPYAHWPDCHSRKEVESLISFLIDDLHITPIPAQNLTSHAGWSRIITRRHVVLDQRPDLAEMWIPGGWCFAVTNAKTKEFLKDIIEDLVKTFRNPPFLHCCCDKCFGFGSTEEERVRPADKLFAEHIAFLHDELAKYDVKMMMWADMLYSSMDVKYWKCSPKVADKLPKDVLINIWTHNDIGEKKWKDIEFFESKGFKTVYSPFLDKTGAKNMVKQCLSHKSMGIVQTTWHKPETALSTVVYTGGYMWTAKEPAEKTVFNHMEEF